MSGSPAETSHSTTCGIDSTSRLAAAPAVSPAAKWPSKAVDADMKLESAASISTDVSAASAELGECIAICVGHVTVSPSSQLEDLDGKAEGCLRGRSRAVGQNGEHPFPGVTDPDECMRRSAALDRATMLGTPTPPG